MWKKIIIIYTGFLVSILILGWFSINYYNQVKYYHAYTNAVEHTYKVLTEAQNLENYLKDAETAQRGFLLTEDSTFLKPYLLFFKNIRPTYNRLVELTTDNTKQKKNLRDLKFTMIRRMEYLTEGLILFKSENKIFKRRLREGKNLMDKCRTTLLKIENEERRLLIIRNSYEEKFKNASSTYSIGAFIFAFIVFVITFLLLIREFKYNQQYQQKLEQKIEELNNRHAELEQIAFVASHDFQEPVRKILTFTDLLKSKYAQSIPEEGSHLFERIKHSSVQLKEALDGLINFTTSIQVDEALQEISLNEVIQNAHRVTQTEFTTREANLTVAGDLPFIMGYPKQMYLLFECLFNNAAKFSRSNDPVSISISCRSANAQEIQKKFKNSYANQRYIKVSVQDYGIGFQNEFSQKIFTLFQRLHNRDSEYSGKGIGLSLVKRIMHNHHGYVSAHGTLNKGATFNLFFPAKM